MDNMIKRSLFILFLSSCAFAREYPVKDIYNPRPTRPDKRGIRVEIVIRENLRDDIVDSIESVYFGNRPIPLSKRDYLGNRGSVFLRASAGTHKIRWSVRNESEEPRVKNYQESITIPKGASLIYILIDKDQLTFEVIQ